MQYTIKTLINKNPSYNAHFGITQEEVDKVNYFVNLIEKSRTKGQPQNGDVIQYVNQSGFYNPGTRLCGKNEKSYLVNTTNYLPSVCQDIPGNGGQIRTHYIKSSCIHEIKITQESGTFDTFTMGDQQYIGTVKADFEVWGNHGACGGGMLTFSAKVNLWKAKARNPFYGEYTTKDWDFQCINTCAREEFEKTGNIFYIYCGNRENLYLYFKNTVELAEYIKLLKGKEFIGNHISHALWCYFDKTQQVEFQHWDKLSLPVINRKINGEEQRVKIQYDDVNHIVISYIPKK